MLAIAKMIGAFIAQIIKVILEVGKKPRKVNPVGYDKDLAKDHKKSIEDILNNDGKKLGE